MAASRIPSPGPNLDVTPISLLLDIRERVAIVETQNSAIISEQSEARESRRLMHRKQDDLDRRLDALDDLKKKVDESMWPQLVEHERIRQYVTGGLAVLVTLGGIALVAAGFILKEIWAWFAGHINWR